MLRAAIAHPGVEIVAVNDPFVDAGEWLVPSSKPLMLQGGRACRYALFRQGMYGCSHPAPHPSLVPPDLQRAACSALNVRLSGAC